MTTPSTGSLSGHYNNIMNSTENLRLDDNSNSNSNNGETMDAAAAGNLAEPGTPNSEGFVTDHRDTDVLCGRGGAALRHPGNQTYRRLVNLNKGLYITCLKTEKLKISRSIVAAIREQKGRFLEKDSKNNAWYDIGDKKAVEKTSQALREGQPKLRQKIAEMGAVSVNQYELELASGDYNSDGNLYNDQQQQHQQQQYAMPPHELMPPPPQIQSQTQQQQQQQQQQILRQQEILQQQQKSFEQLILDGSSHSNHSNSSSGGLRGRQQEMQAMQPPSPLSPNTIDTLGVTGSHSQDLHAEMLLRLSLHDLHTVAATNGDMNQQHQRTLSSGSIPRQLQQQQQQHNMYQQQQVQQLNQQQQAQQMNQQQQAQQMHQQQQVQQMNQQQQVQQMNQQQQVQQMNQQQHMNQQQQVQQMNRQLLQQRQQLMHEQQRNRLCPSLNTRASLARELGIAESQLSLMSEFSAFGGSMSTSVQGLANANNNALMSNSTLMPNAADGLASTIDDIQGIMNIDASFKRALMGLPMGSLHTVQTSSHLSLDNGSMSTGGSTNHSMRFGGSSAAAAAAAAAAVNNANNLDRRRVFAKMKYSRPASVRSPTAAAFGSSSGVSQHGVASQNSLEEMPDFHLLESNMSIYSNISNMTGLDSRTNPAAAAAAAAAAALDTSNFNHMVQNAPSFQMPSNFNNGVAAGGSRVYVETAKVIDHSSLSRSNLFGDVMSGGSRHSIMSGLSRISDTSIDQSIFSDLSRKIGNVSTRSMAMSELSAIDAIELEERDNEDDASSHGNIVEPISAFEHQQRAHDQAMDFDL